MSADAPACTTGSGRPRPRASREKVRFEAPKKAHLPSDDSLSDGCPSADACAATVYGRPNRTVANDCYHSYAELKIIFICQNRKESDSLRVSTRFRSIDSILIDRETRDRIPIICAEGGTRTPMPLRALAPEASASTNSATSANIVLFYSAACLPSAILWCLGLPIPCPAIA